MATILPLRPAPAPSRPAPRIAPRPLTQGEAIDEGPRRVLNVAIALAGLLLTLPLMLVIGAIVLLTSGRPVIYTQTRVGLDRRRGQAPSDHAARQRDLGGAPFTMYKFRTMRHSNGPVMQVWASPTDARVTRIGRFLRRSRLDELPQLVNVLLGDMNIVGPRPEQPEIFATLRSRISGYPGRQRVRPGITGWAQVNLPYDRSVDDVRRKVACDLEYIGRQSVREDLRIMLRTVPVMLGWRGGW